MTTDPSPSVARLSEPSAALLANYEYAVFQGDTLWSSGYSSITGAQAKADALACGDSRPYHVRRRPYGEWEPVTHAKTSDTQTATQPKADGS